jgi:acetyltransferase-like isoleucine patch superfamily enzyme
MSIVVEPPQWTHGSLPPNVTAGPGTLVTGELCFKRFRSKRDGALVIGEQCTMDGTHFALGPDAIVSIGDFCYFTNAVLLAELKVRIGNYVVIGWNATIADTDFHPIAPAERIADAIVCSPLGAGRPRPHIERRPVIIGNDVWIGPNATILKGVCIGDGAIVEPGALVVHDIPAGARVIGNPARAIE